MDFYNGIILSSLKKSAKTSKWLLRIILPISLAARFLDYYGILVYFADFLNPVFIHLGLPGSTAIVFITSIFLPLYAPSAIIMSMSISLRELTILALMCQISHNLPVESAIQAKTGTSFWSMALLRIFMSTVIGLFLNLILPKDMGMPLFTKIDAVTINSIDDLLSAWLRSSLRITMLIATIVFVLNALFKILETYNLIKILGKGTKYMLIFFGVPETTGFLWLIGYIVGLTYGGALMMDQMNEGKVSRHDAGLLNYHLAISHSILEDNLLFVALGVSLYWILCVRLVAAWIVVWLRRLYLQLKSWCIYSSVTK